MAGRVKTELLADDLLQPVHRVVIPRPRASMRPAEQYVLWEVVDGVE